MAYSQNGWSVDPLRSSRTVPGTSLRIVVRDGPAGDLLIEFLRRFHERVEPLDHGQLDDWGYAHRPIAGTTVFSNHASATAVDVNALQHVQGRHGTFTGAQVREIRAILVEFDHTIAWGGDWSNVDEMHFEINRYYGPELADLVAHLTGEDDMPTAKEVAAETVALLLRTPFDMQMKRRPTDKTNRTATLRTILEWTDRREVATRAMIAQLSGQVAGYHAAIVRLLEAGTGVTLDQHAVSDLLDQIEDAAQRGTSEALAEGIDVDVNVSAPGSV